MVHKKNIRDSYKFYLETTDIQQTVTLRIFLDIVLGFIKFMMQKMFDGYDVYLSSNSSLGFVGIRGSKITPTIGEDGNIKGMAPDWKATNELWAANPEAKTKKQLVFHLNEHTNSIRYRIVWFKAGMKVLNKDIYSLIFSKGINGNKRMVSKMIKQGKEYLVT